MHQWSERLYFGAQFREEDKFSVLFKGEQKIFIAAYGEQSFFSICFQFQDPPLVINGTSLIRMTQNQI